MYFVPVIEGSFYAGGTPRAQLVSTREIRVFFSGMTKCARGVPRLPQNPQRNHWCTPTRDPLVHSNKGTIGPLQQGNHWSTPTREPLVHSNKGTIGPLLMVNNTQIYIKRSSVGHFGTSPIPKCTVFKALHARDRDIAPKPLK